METSAVTSCRRGFATGVIAARGCVRLSRRLRPSAPRGPRRFLAIAASACTSVVGVSYEDWALQRRVVADHAAWLAAGIASDGSRRMTGARHNIKPYPLTARPAGKINLTDPDARTLKSPRGWVLGYNAQAVVTAAQIIVAAEVDTENIDRANLQPMIQTACDELRAAGVDRAPEVVVV